MILKLCKAFRNKILHAITHFFIPKVKVRLLNWLRMNKDKIVSSLYMILWSYLCFEMESSRFGLQ